MQGQVSKLALLQEAIYDVEDAIADAVKGLCSKIYRFFRSYLKVFDGVSWNNLPSKNSILLIVTVVGFVYCYNVLIGVISQIIAHMLIPSRLRRNCVPTLSGKATANLLLDGTILAMVLQILYMKENTVLAVISIVAIYLTEFLTPNRTIVQSVANARIEALAGFLTSVSLSLLVSNLKSVNLVESSNVIVDIFTRVFVIVILIDMVAEGAVAWLSICRMALSRITFISGTLFSLTTIFVLAKDIEFSVNFSKVIMVFKTLITYGDAEDRLKVVLTFISIGSFIVSSIAAFIIIALKFLRTRSLCFKDTLIKIYRISMIENEIDEITESQEIEQR